MSVRWYVDSWYRFCCITVRLHLLSRAWCLSLSHDRHYITLVPWFVCNITADDFNHLSFMWWLSTCYPHVKQCPFALHRGNQISHGDTVSLKPWLTSQGIQPITVENPECEAEALVSLISTGDSIEQYCTYTLKSILFRHSAIPSIMLFF